MLLQHKRESFWWLAETVLQIVCRVNLMLERLCLVIEFLKSRTNCLKILVATVYCITLAISFKLNWNQKPKLSVCCLSACC